MPSWEETPGVEREQETSAPPAKSVKAVPVHAVTHRIASDPGALATFNRSD